MENENFIFTVKELKRLSEVDIRTVDKETLVDIEKVHIRTELSKEERLKDYIQKIKNPYCYVANGVIVKLSFGGKGTLEQCLSRCISHEKKF